jgi:hypothetical protein
VRHELESTEESWDAKSRGEQQVAANPTISADNRSAAMTVGTVWTTLTLLEKRLTMKDLDRRVSVAPMMDWSDEVGSKQ